MANTSHRIDSSGNIFIAGQLDEIALQGSDTKHRIDNQGNLYVIEFDEVNDPYAITE